VASVAMLRAAARTAWRETGRRGAAPKLKGLGNRINWHAGRDIIGHTYATLEEKQKNYGAEDYYILIEPEPWPPLDIETGPSLFETTTGTGTESGEEPNQNPAEPTGVVAAVAFPRHPLPVPRSADIMALAKQIQECCQDYDHLAREELVAAAVDMAGDLERCGLRLAGHQV
jgi:hypothetical protein